MGSGSAYNYIAMKEAIADSGLEEKDVSNFVIIVFDTVEQWAILNACKFFFAWS